MKKTILLFAVLITSVASSFGQTGDPWIKKVYNDTWGRNPTAFEYNITNYNNGHWNNYSELMRYIYEFQKNLNSNGISFKYSQKTSANKIVVGIFQNGVQIAADLISNDGGSIAVWQSTKGASFGSAYTLQSSDTKVIKTSSSGALIIR